MRHRKGYTHKLRTLLNLTKMEEKNSLGEQSEKQKLNIDKPFLSYQEHVVEKMKIDCSCCRDKTLSTSRNLFVLMVRLSLHYRISGQEHRHEPKHSSYFQR